MGEENLSMVLRLLTAVAAGGLIGFERSFRGRPAGFRTHTIVCLASAALMLVTVYQDRWLTSALPDSINMDPTRMAQGIMTGIGFLGAGVIFKEGISVRGLTTAASIWITSAVGILIGIGFYFPAAMTVVVVLFVLSVFRWIEVRIPTQNYGRLELVYAKDKVMDEAVLRAHLAAQGFTVVGLDYRLMDQGERFSYRMMIQTTDPKNFSRLTRRLLDNGGVLEFRLSLAE
jgi:putative Mg2+ transporter-C (MgtC) family protein